MPTGPTSPRCDIAKVVHSRNDPDECGLDRPRDSSASSEYLFQPIAPSDSRIIRQAQVGFVVEIVGPVLASDPSSCSRNAGPILPIPVPRGGKTIVPARNLGSDRGAMGIIR